MSSLEQFYKNAYDAGVRQALIDAGVVKQAEQPKQPNAKVKVNLKCDLRNAHRRKMNYTLDPSSAHIPESGQKADGNKFVERRTRGRGARGATHVTRIKRQSPSDSLKMLQEEPHLDAVSMALNRGMRFGDTRHHFESPKRVPEKARSNKRGTK